MANEAFIKELQRKRSSFNFFKIFLFIGLPVLLAGGAGAYFFLMPQEKAPAPTAPVLQTATVQKGDLAISLSSDGSIKNANTADLTFSMDGTITKLTAVAGQKVKKGDILGSVDTSTLDAQIKKAQIDLDLANINFDKVQSQTDDSDITIATQNLKDAQANVEDVQKQTATNIANAQTAYTLAQSNFDKVNSQLATNGQTSKADLDQANLDITLAEKNVEIAKSNQQNSQASLDLDISKAYLGAASEITSATEKMSQTLDEINRVLDLRPALGGAVFDKSYGISGYYSAADSDTHNASTVEFQSTTEAFDALKAMPAVSGTSDPAAVQASLTATMSVMDQLITLLKTVNVGLTNTVTSTTFTKDNLLTMRTSFQSLQSSMENERDSLVNANNAITSANLAKQNKTLSDANAVTSAENTLKSKQQALLTLQTKQTADTAGSDDTILNAKTQLQNAQKNIDTVKQEGDTKLRSAQSQVTVAQQQLNAKLVSTKSTDLLTQQKQVESAQLNLKTAQDALKNAQLIAPIDGEVTVVNNKVGDTIQKGGTTPIVTIVNKDNFELDCNIEQADIAKLAVGQKVNVSVDAVGAELKGEVYSVADSGTADNNGIVTYLVKTTIPNTDVKVRVGMSASAEFILKGVENALIVPVAAVVNKDGKPSVEMENKTWVPVTTGFTDGQKVEILTGLQEGDRILYK